MNPHPLNEEKNVTMFGKFGLYIPDELWFDVATLKIDLRPAISELIKANPKPHVHKFRKYYNLMKCKCGVNKLRYQRL